jgi:tetratricopeptide (TPR) repeat protein
MNHIFRYSITSLALCALSLSFQSFASTATAPDKALQALLDDNKWSEVEKISRERVVKNAKDEQAHRYWTASVLPQNDSKKRQAALEGMEACITTLPQSSVCHHAAGQLLGIQAMEAGMLKAMGSIGRIKELLTKGVEFDPLYYDARRDLIQFYLQAPGIAGGSVSKARELAQAATDKQPEHAKLLKATLAMHDKKPEDAEKILGTVKLIGNEELEDDLDGAWVSLGFTYAGNKAVAKAKPIFERMVKEKPTKAMGHFYLGRILVELGEFESAIPSLTQAAKLDSIRNGLSGQRR